MIRSQLAPAAAFYGNLDEPEHCAPPIPPKNGRAPLDYLNRRLVPEPEQLERVEVVEQRRVLDYENGATSPRRPLVPPKPKAR